MRSSVGVSLGTCGIRTSRTTEDGTWTDAAPFDDWQLSPSPEDVARVVRGIVDRPDAPQSLGIAYRTADERDRITKALAEEYVSDVHLIDETDAALDESNSKKYGDMLESLAKKAQLIIITHNRETMSHAGVLYGITMGKDAVSRVLSIKFDDASALASR